MSGRIAAVKRGRRPKTLPEKFPIVEFVFLARYGVDTIPAEAFHRRLPMSKLVPAHWGPTFGREPGTVDGYNYSVGDGGRRIKTKVKASLSVLEACKWLEGAFRDPAIQHIAPRRSAGLTREGEATRRALHRLLAEERQRIGRREQAAEEAAKRADWNRKLAERRRKKGRQGI
jgi:hypothetical protein